MTELEKLQNAARLIESMTEGRNRFIPGYVDPAVTSSESANLGIVTGIDRYTDGKYTVSFTAYMRKIGQLMTSEDARNLVSEAGQMRDLLAVLETHGYHPTSGDLREFAKSLSQPEEQTGKPVRSFGDKVKVEMKRLRAGSDPAIRKTVAAYISAVANSPPLNALGADDGYRKIAEFGGAVLVGMKYDISNAGYEFATFETYYDDQEEFCVRDGEYFSDEMPDAFAKAKPDFAVRSGLVDYSQIFRQEPLQEPAQAM
jgi:hypothetical protein